MSRSGYHENYENWENICWRGAAKQARLCDIVAQVTSKKWILSRRLTVDEWNELTKKAAQP